MGIRFEQASMDDPDELIRLRIAYMRADFGDVREDDRVCIEKQLRDHFSRKLGRELIAFAAKDEDRIVSVAYLPVIEMPANPTLRSGLHGIVLNVYTEPDYCGRGLSTRVLKELLAYGRDRGLGRIDLSSTVEGYRIYKSLGFEDRDGRCRALRYTYSGID